MIQDPVEEFALDESICENPKDYDSDSDESDCEDNGHELVRSGLTSITQAYPYAESLSKSTAITRKLVNIEIKPSSELEQLKITIRKLRSEDQKLFRDEETMLQDISYEDFMSCAHFAKAIVRGKKAGEDAEIPALPSSLAADNYRWFTHQSGKKSVDVFRPDSKGYLMILAQIPVLTHERFIEVGVLSLDAGRRKAKEQGVEGKKIGVGYAKNFVSQNKVTGKLSYPKVCPFFMKKIEDPAIMDCIHILHAICRKSFLQQELYYKKEQQRLKIQIQVNKHCDESDITTDVVTKNMERIGKRFMRIQDMFNSLDGHLESGRCQQTMAKRAKINSGASKQLM